MAAPRRFFLALGLLATAFYAAFVARTAFRVAGETYFSLFDDAMISMRFARNLADGFGLTWNPGQPPVEGYTNFAWTLWMAALHKLPVPEAWVSLLVMLTGVVILLALLGVVRAIALRLSDGAFLPAAIATALVAFYYPLVFWTLRGMEVGALLLLVYGAVLLAFRLHDRFRGGELAALGGMLALALLTRLDAVIPHVLISTFLLWVVPRQAKGAALAVLGASFVVPLGAHTAFRLAYYHEWLPNTYYLKVTGVSLLDRLTRGVKVFMQSYGYHLWPYLAAVPGVLLARRSADRRVLLLGALVLFQAAYSIYVGGDAWEWLGSANRFLVAAMPAVAVLAGLGIEAIVKDARVRVPALRAGALVLAGALAARSVLALWQVSPEPKVAGIWLLAGGLVGAAGWWLAPALTRFLAERRPWPAVWVAVACAVLLTVPANARLGAQWLLDDAIHVKDDAEAARLGLFLRHSTEPEATIAVTWAGAIPYFAHRHTLDLLGKSDPAIAKGPPATPDFFPGHNKWNFAYSIGELHPDVVVQFYESTDNNADMARWGYERLANGMWLRRDTTRVNRDAIGRNWKDPVVLDSWLKGR